MRCYNAAMSFLSEWLGRGLARQASIRGFREKYPERVMCCPSISSTDATGFTVLIYYGSLPRCSWWHVSHDTYVATEIEPQDGDDAGP
jgi:hypothetical protein